MSTPIAAANISDGESEDSKIGQFVAILTPIFAAGAGLIVGWVAKQLPGVQLDQTQITAFMVTIATSALASGWKWLTGWQQHERLVAQGLAVPRKAGRRKAAGTLTRMHAIEQGNLVPPVH
jgi:hypothetical protein